MGRGVGQHHGDLRRSLLDAALELVAEGNPASITLRGVARRAGVSSAAPYHHFPDKAALLAEVAHEGFVSLAQAQAACGGDPRSRLASMCASYVRFAVAHRTHYAVMFRTLPSRLEGEPGERLERVALGTFQTLLQAIADANPALSGEALVRRGVLAWSIAHGAVEVSRWAGDLGPDLSTDVLADDVADAVIRVICAPQDDASE